MAASDFSKGNQLLRSNKLEEAVVAYRKAIASEPNFYWYHLKMGKALEQLGYWEEAAIAYCQVVETKSKVRQPWSYWDLGRVLRKLGKNLEASEVEEKARKIERNWEERQSHLEIYLELKNSSLEDISNYPKSIDLKKSSYWLKREHSNYLCEIRKIINQIGIGARSIIDVGSNGCPYLDWFAWIPERYSVDLRKPYKAPGIVDITTDFLKYNPDKTFDILTCLQVIEHVPDAQAFCQKLLKTARILVVSVPYQWPAGATTGHIHDPVDLEKMNNWFGREPNYYSLIAESNSFLQRLISVYNIESNLKSDQLEMLFESKGIAMVSKFEEGNQLQRMNKLEKAVEAYRATIQDNPSFYWVYQKLGEIFYKLGRLDEAEEAFHQGISVNPNSAWLHLSLARILVKQQRWDDAITSYRQAIQLQLDRPRVYYELGKALATVELWDESIAVYQKAIKQDKTQYKYYYSLADALLKHGRLEEAATAYNQAVSLKPDDTWYHYRLAGVLRQLGRESEAVKVEAKAIEIEPGLTQMRATIESPVPSKNQEIKIYRADEMIYTPFHIKANHNFLKREGFVFIDDVRKADILVSRNIKNLYPYIKQYGTRKKYLIWTHEPRFDINFFDDIYVFTNIKVDIMNAYTQNIYVNNYKYFNLPNMNPINVSSFERIKGKTVVIVAACKKAVSLIKDGLNIDLIKIRNDIAYSGFNLGKVDIYGPGWGKNLAIEDSRKVSKLKDENQYKRKIKILKNYHFNLCFENTNYPYYCTEKIWHSLDAGCLPIYYGKGNAIYEDFPADSFLDYSEFNHPEALFEYIDSMTIDEFKDRMNKCIETVNKIASLTNQEGGAIKIQNQNIIDKLKSIFKRELQLSSQPALPTESREQSVNWWEPPGENIALHKPAQQSSYSPRWSKPNQSSRAVNGIKNGGYSFCTKLEVDPWWQVDLEEIHIIQQVRIYNRMDYSERARTLKILLSTDSHNWEQVYVNDDRLIPGGIYGKPLIVSITSKLARYIRIQLNSRTYLHLDEVEVYGY